jgi:hypothetical protein
MTAIFGYQQFTVISETLVYKRIYSSRKRIIILTKAF